MVLNEQLKIPSLRELLKITFNKDEWQLQSPFKKWCYLYGIGRSCVNTIGYTAFKDDQSLSWLMPVPFIYIGLYTILAIYTAFYYINKGEPFKCLPCTCLMVGPLFASLPVMIKGVKKARFGFHKFLGFAGHCIYPDTRTNTAYDRLCMENIDTTLKKFFRKAAIMLISLVATGIGPAYMQIRHGIKTTASSLKFPLIEENSNAEFVANMFLQVFISFYGVLAFAGIEICVDIVGDVVSIMSKLIEYEFNKLDAAQKCKKKSSLLTRGIFRNIIKQCIDFESYVVQLTDSYYYRTFITPPGYTYSIGMSIFCQVAMNFAAGYALAVMSWVQLFYICEVGENVDNNCMCEKLYNSHWYTLPIKYQKDLQRLMDESQHGVRVPFGPIDIVNREFLKSITKKLYTFVMFLFRIYS